MTTVKAEKTNGTVAAAAAKAGPQVLMLQREAIRPDPNQPRKFFDPVALQSLAVSIHDQGIVQPLIVEYVPQKFTLHEPDLTCKRWQILDAAGKAIYTADTEKACRAQFPAAAFEPYYKLVAGERRWRAAGIAEVNPVPCLLRPVLDAKDKFKIQHAENAEREGLTPLDEAESYHQAVHTDKLFTAEELAAEMGKSRSHVYGRLKLATLPKAIKETVARGDLNAELAALVAKVPGEKNQLKAMKEIVEGGEVEWLNDECTEKKRHAMSVRQAKRYLREKYMLELAEAPFDIKDKMLVPAAGACANCPKRSDNCAETFPELAKFPNVCTDPDCFAAKKSALVQRAREAAQDDGFTVLPEKETKELFSKYGGFDPYGVKSVADLKAEVPGDKQKRTYKQLLGKDAPERVAAISTEGKTHLFYQKNLIDAALQQKGFSFKDPHARGNSPKESPAEIAKRERLKAAREKLAKEVRPKALAAAVKLPELEFLRLLATQSLQNYGLEDVLEACGIKWKGDEPKLADIVRNMKLPALRALLVHGHVLEAETETNYQGGFEEQFEELCEFAGIDLKAQEALVVKWAEQDAAVDADYDAKGVEAAHQKLQAKAKAKGKKG